MADERRFEQWWATVARPELQRHLLGRRYEADIKQGAQIAWNAALDWQPGPSNKPEPRSAS